MSKRSIQRVCRRFRKFTSRLSNEPPTGFLIFWAAVAAALFGAAPFVRPFNARLFVGCGLLIVGLCMVAIVARPVARSMATIASWVVRRIETLIGGPVRNVLIFERVFEYLRSRASRDQLKRFLKGFCSQYLCTTHPRTIAEHCVLALGLSKQPIQLKLKNNENSHTLTVVTENHAGLGAAILEVLTERYDMNIRSSYLFVNSADIAVGTFYCESEDGRGSSKIQHLLRDVRRCISGELPLLPCGKAHLDLRCKAYVDFQKQVRFNDFRSRCSTLLEFRSRDRHGLLLDITSELARNGCDIRAAIVETHGSQASDSFYITKDGEKLDPMTQANLQETLLSL